jgi:hypothetical protein
VRASVKLASATSSSPPDATQPARASLPTGIAVAMSSCCPMLHDLERRALAPGEEPTQTFERVGRPEVKNFLLALRTQDRVNRDIDLRDLYNLEDPFHVGPDYRGAYRARLDANLAYMDTFDDVIGWPLGPNGEHPLTELFLADHLVVDVSRPYAENGFLEIERASLSGRRHRGCGGRSVNDDVMDALYTFVIGGVDVPRISDGVHQATRRGTTTFPYLVLPNRTAVPPRPVGATSAAAHDHEHHSFGRYQVG